MTFISHKSVLRPGASSKDLAYVLDISVDSRELNRNLHRASPKTTYVLRKNMIHFLWIYGVCPVSSGTKATWKTPRIARKLLVSAGC